MNIKIKNLYLIQTVVALCGTVFAYGAVIVDYRRFYAIEGSLTKVQNCSIPNPVTTPCFWGAFAFLVATIWSVVLYKRYRQSGDESNESIKSIKKQQKYFTAFAAFGTAFAWGNMTLEFIKYFKAAGQTYTGCSGMVVSNPLLTPCFGGSTVFLALLITSIYLYKKTKV